MESPSNQNPTQKSPSSDRTDSAEPTVLNLKDSQVAAEESLKALVSNAKGGVHQPHESTRTSVFTSYFQALTKSVNLEGFETAWHLGNYVIDRQTGKKSVEPMPIYVRLGMYFLYYGASQEAVLQWKRVQYMLKCESEQMGAGYDAPQSKAHIKEFIKTFSLQESLKDLIQPDPEKYANFNEFFAREMKPSARPIAEPDDPLVFSSPADCRLTVFPTVNQATKYWIKGHGFTISNLLHSETLAKAFDGGSIAIARLAPQDYHRWHSPVDGYIESIIDIPGTYYTVNPMAVNQPGVLNVFCQNKRSVMIIRRSPTSSPIALVAVGAMLVGSVKYNPGILIGTHVKRGQCLGCFQYGGSTVIMLCPAKEMTLDEDLVANSTQQKHETLVRVGWRIGKGPLPTQETMSDATVLIKMAH